MKKKSGQFIKVVLVAVSATVGLISAAGTATASTVYHRSGIKAVKSTAMYSNSNKGKTYRFKGSASHFTFKTSHHLKNYHHSTWTKTKQTTVKHGHHSSTYFYVKNAKNGAAGWVNATYMKTGKDYQMGNSKSITSKDYIMKSSGKVYQLKGNSNWFQFKEGKQLSGTATYAVTAQRSIYKKGKASIYYYVVGTDGSKGWTWHGYLTAGDHQSAVSTGVKPTGSNSVSSDGSIHVNSPKDIDPNVPGFYTYTENANDSWTAAGNRWSDKVRALLAKSENETPAEVRKDQISYNSRGQKIDWEGNVIK